MCQSHDPHQKPKDNTICLFQQKMDLKARNCAGNPLVQHSSLTYVLESVSLSNFLPSC